MILTYFDLTTNVITRPLWAWFPFSAIWRTAPYSWYYRKSSIGTFSDSSLLERGQHTMSRCCRKATREVRENRKKNETWETGNGNGWRETCTKTRTVMKHSEVVTYNCKTWIRGNYIYIQLGLLYFLLRLYRKSVSIFVDINFISWYNKEGLVIIVYWHLKTPYIRLHVNLNE